MSAAASRRVELDEGNVVSMSSPTSASTVIPRLLAAAFRRVTRSMSIHN
jgi:hypothetical protein